MPLKFYKPVTPAQRGKVSAVNPLLSKGKPEKSLLAKKNRISGRSNAGRISVRRRGGGHKRRYRIIDFRRNKYDVVGKVDSLQYDPNRTAYIALVVYSDGEKRYILATENMREGASVLAGKGIRSEEGNHLPLSEINIGSFIHNIEISPGRGGQMVRSAGGSAKLLGRDGDYVSVQFPSGEVRRVLGRCYASVGVISNKDKKNENSGKAGRTRWQGRRPKVRGVVMNPVDHPMGGGEGRSSGGRHPCSPTGKPTKGFKTRARKKYSDRLIVRGRKGSKRG